MLCEHLEPSKIISDTTQTVFTEAEGIWKCETTKGQVVKAMRHAMEALAKYCENLPESERNEFSAFPCPRVLNTYAAP
eukprot:6967537-Ditylum_brightwellii.AAC.1